MGGDHAPNNEVLGSLQALASISNDLELILVGQQDRIEAALQGKHRPEHLTVIHAPDVITMSDEPATIVKSRKDSSLYIGLNLMREGLADAFVSAGNTGGVMATATMLCGRIPGVSRPTIGSFFPTQTGQPTLLVDVGANVDSKPRFLHDYAVMGSIYTELILGIQCPKVGLLNVGEEEGKGTAVAQEAYGMLRSAPINFVGNVEGRDILRGTVDVVVCDGFEGNIVLKFAESILGFLKSRFRDFANKSFINKVLVGMFTPVLRTVLRGMDYQEYGGVPLLGINGVVIIGHGSSSPKALENMILRAVEVVQRDVNGRIREVLAPPTTTKEVE
jgi:glycerol-3-phosphate acyltransferase PlsX